MSRILVTGVDGFTGRYLAPALAAEGHEVHGLLQREWPSGLPLPDGVHAVHACELLDPQGLIRVAAQVRTQLFSRVRALGSSGLARRRTRGPPTSSRSKETARASP